MKYQIIMERRIKEDLRIGHSREVFDLVTECINLHKDKIFVILLDASCYLIKIHILDFKKFYPELTQKIFKLAQKSSSKTIVTAQSRNPEMTIPTAEDIQIIEDMVMKGSQLEIEVLDHLIVEDDGYFSFADNKLATLSKDEVWPYKPI
ncbi:MAG: hypothetical protein OCD02_11235 [Spirochaetaceae bacterium]